MTTRKLSTADVRTLREIRTRIIELYPLLQLYNTIRDNRAFGAVLAGDYSQFDVDGVLRFFGGATVWNDVNLGAATLGVPASNNPDIDEFVDNTGADTGIETRAFATGEYLSGVFEIPHSYRKGSDVYPHVHWQGIVAPAGGTDNLQWQLTYAVARNNITLDPATTIVIQRAFTTQYSFVRSNFPVIAGATAGPGGTPLQYGDQFLLRLGRIAATSDEYAGDALIATNGLHFEQDSVGSNTISQK